jgi:hypothetical protein
MNGKWSDYKYCKNVKITERFKNLIVYRYYDQNMEEERYAVVVEDLIMLNSREYPNKEIHSIADVYGGILRRRKAG